MASLDLAAVGTWAGALGTGRIARWGDSLVNYYRVDSPASRSTTFVDTGAAAAFTTVTVTNSIGTTGSLYAHPAEGSDSVMVLWRDDDNLVSVDSTGAQTVIAARIGTSGGLLAATGRANYGIAYATEESTPRRLGEYYLPSGVTPTTIATVSSPEQFTARPWVDLATDDIIVGLFEATVSRKVRRYDPFGATVWTATIPSAATDSVVPVGSIVGHPLGLIAYTADVDMPGGVRANNNWWLINPSTGSVSLLDVTIAGVAFATWAETGSNEISAPAGGGQIVAVGNRIFAQAVGGDVLGTAAGRWRVGRVGWPVS